MIIYYTGRYGGVRSESRSLLEKALFAYTGDPGTAKELMNKLETGEKGKPYIKGAAPFSVSHSGNIWAVLFADRECGLDIQLEKKCDVRSISRRFFDPEDAGAIEAAGVNDAQGLFFRIWARREALIKAMGGSIADTGIPSVLKDQLLSGGVSYSISDISIPGLPEVHAAVCIEGEAPEELSFAELI